MAEIRLQKFLSDCGICSRRKAEYYIENLYIRVNGELVTKLGTKIDPKKDIVHFQEKLVEARKKHTYMILNKPPGYTCTMADFKSEQNLSSLLPKIHHLYPVGRLDKDSEGLMILTTDGAFAQKVMHPSNKCEKEYLVICIGDVKEKDLEQMKKGIILPRERRSDEEETARTTGKKVPKPKAARIKSGTITKRDTGRTYLAIILEEGQKRQIRRMFQFLHFTVQYLKRVRIGSVELGTLPKGKARDLSVKEIASLSESVDSPTG